MQALLSLEIELMNPDIASKSEDSPRCKIFTGVPALWPDQKRNLDQSYASAGAFFESREAHDAFFSYLITPKSGRWAFVSAGKTGTSSALDLLFSIEFGHRNTVSVNDPTDLNRDAQTHRCLNHGIFRPLRGRADITSFQDYLEKSVRIATVRNPVNRLWSAFRYLCRSGKESHPMFLGDRLKMCALVGFDWNSHPYNREGFTRFLEYIRIIKEETNGNGLNNHWKHQWMIIRPDFYKPDIIGRAENPSIFARDLIEMLNGDPALETVWRNPSDAKDRELPEYFAEVSIRNTMADLYAEDFQAFGYDL
jgi:hypothetical protein